MAAKAKTSQTSSRRKSLAKNKHSAQGDSQNRKTGAMPKHAKHKPYRGQGR